MIERKLFEKVDDNPGDYFGMLVEGFEDLAYDDEVPGYEPKKRAWADEKYDELMNKGKDKWSQDDWDSYNYIMQVWGESGVFDESLKEGIDKKQIDLLYSRYGFRDRKFALEVGHPDNIYNKLKYFIKEDGMSSVEREFRVNVTPCAPKDIYKNSISVKEFLRMYEQNESLKESVSKSDLYSALEYMYGFNKKEANDWIKKASDKMKQSVVDGWKGNAKKSALTDSLKEDKYFIVKSFYDGPHGFYGVIEDTSVIDNNGEYKKYRFNDREELKKFASELVSKGYKNQQGYTKDALLKEDKFVSRDEKIKAISSNPEARKMAQKLTDQGELSLDAIISFVYADFFGKEESLKEDKFVSRDKMSKKDRKELDSKKRNTWGNTNPVTRVQPNKKAYDRKRDKKELDESVRDFDWNRELWCVVNDDGSFAGSPCLSWEEARELSVYHENSRIYDMKLDVDQVYSDEEDLSSYGIETGYYN